ncbi:rhodanese-like domain-containing protein [Sagittula sp. S175]|uniref:rhodanese-like domain-containing protein n=1 Tax=Sagittula sp. S175 TaxID=3415129 RepID=UPI003C7A166A
MPAQTVTRRNVLLLGAGALLAGTALAYGLWLPDQATAQEAQPVTPIAADEAYRQAQAGEIILVDIRTPEEWQQTGVAEGAIGLDMTQDDFVASLVKLREANPDTPLALICRTGNRSGYATEALAKQGFPGLADVKEGMAGGRNGEGWLNRGLPTYAGTPANVHERTRARLGQ